MSAQHTPGPWHVGNSVQGNVTIFGEIEHRQAGFSECCVCIVTPIQGQTEIDDANAHLIAAAPDLRDIVEAWLPGAEAMGWYTEKARAVLAEAKGETQS